MTDPASSDPPAAPASDVPEPGAAGGDARRRSLAATIGMSIVALGVTAVLTVPFLTGVNWLFVLAFDSDRLRFLPAWLQVVLLLVSGGILFWLLVGRGWQTAETWLGALHDLIGNLSGILIGLFAVAIAGDLLLREMQWGNLPGMQELMEYALYVSVFVAAPWALRLGSHIRVDLFLTAMPDSMSRRLEFGIDLFGALLCAFLAYYSFVAVIDAYATGSMQRKTFAIDDGFLRSFLVVSFALLTAEFVFRVHRAREIDPLTDAKQGGF